MIKKIKKVNPIIATILCICLIVTLIIRFNISDNNAEVAEISNPTNIIMTDLTPFSAIISWDKVDGADGYYIKYSYSGSSETYMIDLVDNSYTLEGLDPSKIYDYYVQAYKNMGSRIITSSFTKELTYQPMQPVVSNFNITVDESNYIVLNIEPNNDMLNTIIYKSTDNENYTGVQEIKATDTTWIDSDVSIGNTYYYKIRQSNNNESLLCYTPYSEVKSYTIEAMNIIDNTENTTENTTVEDTTVEITESTEEITTEAPTTEEIIEEVTTEETTTEVAVETDDTSSTTLSEDDAIAYGILDLINEERERLGYEKMVMNEDLKSVAYVRAKEIRTLYSHTRPDGRKWSTAWADANLAYKISRGENLVYGYNDASGFYNSWYNSQGHYENMFDSRYIEVGIAIYTDPDTGLKYAALEATAKVVYVE